MNNFQGSGFRVQGSMRSVKSKIKILFLFFCLFLLSPVPCPLSPVCAAVEVDPLRLELESDSGKISSGYLTLTNRGGEEMEISLSPGEYRYMFSDNTVYPESLKSRRLPSCKAWISFKPDKIKLQKNAPQKIQYAINVPAISAGEYVAAILIDEERGIPHPAPDETGQVMIKITPRISIPVYVATKNTLKRSCAISDLNADARGKSVDIRVTLKNTGTAHVRPVTTLVIIDEYGAVMEKISLGKSLPVFAGFGERLSASWTPRFGGRYTLVATVDTGAEGLIQKSVNFEVKK